MLLLLFVVDFLIELGSHSLMALDEGPDSRHRTEMCASSKTLKTWQFPAKFLFRMRHIDSLHHVHRRRSEVSQILPVFFDVFLKNGRSLRNRKESYREVLRGRRANGQVLVPI